MAGTRFLLDPAEAIFAAGAKFLHTAPNIGWQCAGYLSRAAQARLTLAPCSASDLAYARAACADALRETLLPEALVARLGAPMACICVVSLLVLLISLMRTVLRAASSAAAAVAAGTREGRRDGRAPVNCWFCNKNFLLEDAAFVRGRVAAEASGSFASPTSPSADAAAGRSSCCGRGGRIALILLWTPARWAVWLVVLPVRVVLCVLASTIVDVGIFLARIYCCGCGQCAVAAARFCCAFRGNRILRGLLCCCCSRCRGEGKSKGGDVDEGWCGREGKANRTGTVAHAAPIPSLLDRQRVLDDRGDVDRGHGAGLAGRPPWAREDPSRLGFVCPDETCGQYCGESGSIPSFPCGCLSVIALSMS